MVGTWDSSGVLRAKCPEDKPRPRRQNGHQSLNGRCVRLCSSISLWLGSMGVLCTPTVCASSLSTSNSGSSAPSASWSSPCSNTTSPGSPSSGATSLIRPWSKRSRPWDWPKWPGDTPSLDCSAGLTGVLPASWNTAWPKWASCRHHPSRSFWAFSHLLDAAQTSRHSPHYRVQFSNQLGPSCWCWTRACSRGIRSLHSLCEPANPRNQPQA